MGDKTKIEWTDASWNPVTGCSKVSQGCKNCYAERDWARLAAPRPRPNIYTGRAFTDVQCHPARLIEPWRWKRGRRVFVNSMSDLFHPDVPFEFIASIFAIMGVTTRHTYQVLTKRPDRMVEFFNWVHEENSPHEFAADDRISDHFPKEIPWEGMNAYGHGYDNCGPRYPYENVWLGVSAEDQATLDERWRFLKQTPAAVRFVSLEPLLAEVDMRDCLHVIPVFTSKAYANRGEITGITAPTMHWEQSYNILTREPIKTEIDWVIAGGESGPHARPSHPDWFRSLRDQCQAAGVPYFFKQWGEFSPTGTGNPSRYIHATKPNDGLWHRDADGVIPVWRVGKKAAGRILDGRTWSEYPI